MIEIRPLRWSDIPFIVKIHCSDVEVWRRWAPGRGFYSEASYGDLTQLERWLHGGPWMDETLCRRYYKAITKNFDSEVVVAEVDGRPVGVLELLFEDHNPLLGPHAFMNILWVHRDWRGRGVGSKLVEWAVDDALRRGYPALDVIPEEGSEGFYRSKGFHALRGQVKGLWRGGELTPGRVKPLGYGDWVAVKNMFLVSGLHNTYWWAWFWAWRFEETLFRPPSKLGTHRIRHEPGCATIVSECWWLGGAAAYLYVWSQRYSDAVDCLKYAAGHARSLGFRDVWVQVWDEFSGYVEAEAHIPYMRLELSPRQSLPGSSP